jgi:hypothetical protein
VVVFNGSVYNAAATLMWGKGSEIKGTEQIHVLLPRDSAVKRTFAAPSGAAIAQQGLDS